MIITRAHAFKDLIIRFLPMVGMTVFFCKVLGGKTISSLAKKSFYPPFISFKACHSECNEESLYKIV
jgi:hypothetical protein